MPSRRTSRCTSAQSSGNGTSSTPAASVSNELHLPVGRRVHLVIKSDDVIHSFWVPALGVKQDAVPGPHDRGLHDGDRHRHLSGACARSCAGFGHTGMTTTFVVSRTRRPGRLAEPANHRRHRSDRCIGRSRQCRTAGPDPRAASRRGTGLRPSARRARRGSRHRPEGGAGPDPGARLPLRADRLPAGHRRVPLLADLGGRRARSTSRRSTPRTARRRLAALLPLHDRPQGDRRPVPRHRLRRCSSSAGRRRCSCASSWRSRGSPRARRSTTRS